VLETLAANLEARSHRSAIHKISICILDSIFPRLLFLMQLLPLALPSAALLFAGVMLLGSHPVRPAVRMSEPLPALPDSRFSQPSF
jgi:hypothetical protein